MRVKVPSSDDPYAVRAHHLLDGELQENKSKTPGSSMTFVIVDEEKKDPRPLIDGTSVLLPKDTCRSFLPRPDHLAK